MALAAAAGLPASEPAAAEDGAFSVEDGSGRRLGFITMQTVESSLAAGAFRMAAELPDGRVLVVTHRSEQGLAWISYRDTVSGEELVTWSRRDLARDGGGVPTIRVFGDHAFGFSRRNEEDRAAVGRRDERFRSWLTSLSPTFAKLLERAVEVSIVAEKARFEPPTEERFFRPGVSMVALYSTYGASRKGRPAGVLRRLEPGSKEAERLLSSAASGPAPLFPGPDASRSWSGSLAGGREEPLGRLRLDWTGGAEPGRLAAKIATLDWSEGRRSEKATLLFIGPAGGYFGRIEREVGGDWATVATFEGFGEVEGEDWWAPFRIGDRMAKGGKREVVEIPPSGDRERQRARSALLDAFLAAMKRSGLSEPVAAETLYRWQRVFNLPEVKESLQSIVPLADVLSDAPIPVFRNEVDEPWAGTVDLRDVVTR